MLASKTYRMPNTFNEKPQSASGDIWSPDVHAAFDAVLMGLVVVDPSGMIVFVNSAAERMFLYDSSQWKGLSIEALVPGANRPVHPGHVATFFGAHAGGSSLLRISLGVKVLALGQLPRAAIVAEIERIIDSGSLQ